MRIPPYYRRPAWQRFFSGMAVGGAISWVIFLYIFGVWQEKHTHKIRLQEDEILELKKDINIWQQEYKESNKRNIEQITVQKINVRITNWEKYKLDQLSTFETEESVKDDISMMLAKDLETVYKSKDLIKKIIENKRVKINNKRYKLEVKEMIVYTTLSIELEINFDE
ncbi:MULTISPECIES: sporulation membrane protein YtrI [Bacillus]|uniref:Sporulation protein n=1 Tax=Bacillus salipaludis TaxID=2547811 RepID=A0A4R5VSB9_9BACI|nr:MULTISPECIES: sporulation membrane protein YtrI [Bacillus]MDQ6599917.1 sporulation protein [Bacillus salipaludis]MED1469347.1 sporulation protein [Bacillus salipaludis]TDK61477.1 sporulation protein [Bacillus salipaludis]